VTRHRHHHPSYHPPHLRLPATLTLCFSCPVVSEHSVPAWFSVSYTSMASRRSGPQYTPRSAALSAWMALYVLPLLVGPAGRWQVGWCDEGGGWPVRYAAGAAALPLTASTHADMHWPCAPLPPTCVVDDLALEGPGKGVPRLWLAHVHHLNLQGWWERGGVRHEPLLLTLL
jgi:hypothetical protein